MVGHSVRGGTLFLCATYPCSEGAQRPLCMWNLMVPLTSAQGDLPLHP